MKNRELRYALEQLDPNLDVVFGASGDEQDISHVSVIDESRPARLVSRFASGERKTIPCNWINLS